MQDCNVKRYLTYSLSPNAFSPKMSSMTLTAVSIDKKGRMIVPGSRTAEFFSSDIFKTFGLSDFPAFGQLNPERESVKLLFYYF